MRICNKLENIQALKLSKFGNQIPSWYTKEELIKSGYKKDVAIRSINPGGLLEYPVKIHDALLTNRKDAYFTGSFPDELRTVQGELQQTSFGLYLFYSTLKKNMRDSLKEDPNHAIGLMALSLIKTHMSPSSYDDVQQLLDIYPCHVIEFTCCSKDVGDCKGRNTVIWEVREY